MPGPRNPYGRGGRDHHRDRGGDAWRPDNPYLYDGYTDETHAGKGPKGYRRSDESILDDVCEALTRNADIDASDVEVKVHRGEVTLTGHVPERRMKRLSEDIALNLPGVEEVRNRLLIKRERN